MYCFPCSENNKNLFLILLLLFIVAEPRLNYYRLNTKFISGKLIKISYVFFNGRVIYYRRSDVKQWQMRSALERFMGDKIFGR